MGLEIVEESLCSGLAASLVRMVADPDTSDTLYKLLGTYCHQSRNVLHTMKLSLFLARRGSPPAETARWGKLERDYLEVEHFFDRLQLVCRPMTVNPVRMPLSLLIDDRHEEWKSWLAASGQGLELLAPDAPAIGEYDPARMAQGLDAFVAWRGDSGRAGGSTLLRWWTDDGHFHLDWTEVSDDGRDPSNERPEQPESLALPLLARVVTAHTGTLDIDVRDGLRLRLRWPLHVRRL